MHSRKVASIQVWITEDKLSCRRVIWLSLWINKLIKEYLTIQYLDGRHISTTVSCWAKVKLKAGVKNLNPRRPAMSVDNLWCSCITYAKLKDQIQCSPCSFMTFMEIVCIHADGISFFSGSMKELNENFCLRILLQTCQIHECPSIFLLYFSWLSMNYCLNPCLISAIFHQ